MPLTNIEAIDAAIGILRSNWGDVIDKLLERGLRGNLIAVFMDTRAKIIVQAATRFADTHGGYIDRINVRGRLRGIADDLEKDAARRRRDEEEQKDRMTMTPERKKKAREQRSRLMGLFNKAMTDPYILMSEAYVHPKASDGTPLPGPALDPERLTPHPDKPGCFLYRKLTKAEREANFRKWRRVARKDGANA